MSTTYCTNGCQPHTAQIQDESIQITRHNICMRGIKTDVAMISACEAIDIAFAVPMPRDAAGWTYIKNFVKSFINNFLPIGDQATRVAVVTYNYDGATTQISLSKYHSEADVKAGIDQLTYTPTDYFDDASAMQAIVKVFNTSQRQVQQVAIIVFGDQLMSSSDSVINAGILQGKNIRVISIDAAVKSIYKLWETSLRKQPTSSRRLDSSICRPKSSS